MFVFHFFGAHPLGFPIPSVLPSFGSTCSTCSTCQVRNRQNDVAHGKGGESDQPAWREIGGVVVVTKIHPVCVAQCCTRFFFLGGNQIEAELQDLKWRTIKAVPFCRWNCHLDWPKWSLSSCFLCILHPSLGTSISSKHLDGTSALAATARNFNSKNRCHRNKCHEASRNDNGADCCCFCDVESADWSDWWETENRKSHCHRSFALIRWTSCALLRCQVAFCIYSLHFF